jgi:2-iminoacetate synthase
MEIMTDKGSSKWIENRIVPDQIERYLYDGKCFIDEGRIEADLARNRAPDPGRVRDIIAKSLAVETLSPDECATLLHVDDPGLRAEMEAAAQQVKLKVYDNRIVTFAPLYLSNHCVNDCSYCAFRRSNSSEVRRSLSRDEIVAETRALAGDIGHKRLIVVYGEHPRSGVDYIAETMQDIYSVKVPTKHGFGSIRRCNVNAAPMSITELEQLAQVGIGTYQVFQETYHPATYAVVHPQDTIKGNYLWRLYCMHRAMEAGIDDHGIGVLFGLYDWRFEVMGLLYHALDLERRFGVGPHTVSFPRLEPASNTPFNDSLPYKVSDDDFRKLITVIRLAIPYTGMILTARESEQIRRDVIGLGCTQTDASTRIGIGAYADDYREQEGERQQFMLGDTRSLDELVREFCERGWITSFCTAGYRCGRTGTKIMKLLRSGREGNFCKLNAIITFREWLDDFASDATKAAGERVIAMEMEQVRERLPEFYPQLSELYEKTKAGDRDIYF